MTTLSEYRSTLESLQAYEFPEDFQRDSIESTEEAEQFVKRYENARDKYLTRHLEELFHEHLRNFDGESVPIPEELTDAEKEDLKKSHKQAEERLKESMNKVYEKQQLLRSKYETFTRRREEVTRMVSDMEEPVSDDDDEDKENDSEDVTEQELADEEQKCNVLATRRADLEQKLAKMRSEVAKKEKQLQDTNRRLVEIRQEERPTIENVTDFQAETLAMREKADKLNEMSEWYTSMRGLVEELNGMKIMEVQNDQDSNAVFLKVQLLGAHDIEVRLLPDHRRELNLRVQNAKFLTSTIVKSSTMDQSHPLELSIPDLVDLVQLCTKMGPVEDLRFLLREARGRIRAISARVEELSVLRAKYLTKMGGLRHSGHSFGGEDQEIVCSIKEGVTVVLKLTPDCPLVNGSVYVDQIIGVGGWDQGVLDDIKSSMNDLRCRSPLQLMDALKEELTRLEKSDDFSLPKTPQMPTRFTRGLI